MRGGKSGMCSVDRAVMWVFAIVELVVLIAALVQVAECIDRVNHKTVKSSKAQLESDTDTKQRLHDLLVGSVGLLAYSLVALVAVSAYYTVGGMLKWLGHRADSVKANVGSPMAMAMAPSRGDDGTVRILAKMLNIAVGAVGIVTVSWAAGLLQGAWYLPDYIQWEHADDKDDTQNLIVMAFWWTIVALVMKLLEALLGHLWAINLSNHRDKMTHLRDGELLRGAS